MSKLLASSGYKVIIGLGATGLSLARYFSRNQPGMPLVALDTSEQPTGLEKFKQEFPHLDIRLGAIDRELLLNASEVVLSPGVPRSLPEIQQAVEAGVSVVGDVDLFVREISAPLVAITGSNAKSTVTTLVGNMAARDGRRVLVGGNLGTPVLDLLAEDSADEPTELYVLELSSFQLESTANLNATVACILNICPDHLDRYASIADYHRAKQRVYFNADHVVVNRGDILTKPPAANGVSYSSFGLNQPDFGEFGLRTVDGEEYLAYQLEPLIPISKLTLSGRHNVENALAALAIGHAAGLSMAVMLEEVQEFSGLEHRCQTVDTVNEVVYINDSKGTNVGATIAAIKGLAFGGGKIIWIAGGMAKGASFACLVEVLEQHVRAAVLIGSDAQAIAEVAAKVTEVIMASTMEDAVLKASQQAQTGDVVLLSPACASFDMFDNYKHRGQVFMDAVQGLAS